MKAYGLDYMRPTVAALAMYTQFLANSYPSPATVKNYMSGAKNWLLLYGGFTYSFQAYELGMMSKAVAEKSNHVPAQAPPITPEDVAIICKYIDDNPIQHIAIKAAILLAFSTFLRVSNVLSPTRKPVPGNHTLMAKDVRFDGHKLHVYIRSTKTRRNGKVQTLFVLPGRYKNTCPVTAWIDYKEAINPCPLGPAFMIDQRYALTPGPVVAIMRLALAAAGKQFNKKISFHSLRRGGAQTAASEGASDQDLMTHGTWKSKSGLAAYIKPPPSMVPALLARTLAH